MKQLILITTLLVAMTTKLLAQESKAIEIKNLSNQTAKTSKETHQFEIVAKEDVDVNLKFDLKLEGNINVLVTDNQKNVVLSKAFKKSGQNYLAFAMQENEKYTIMLEGNKQSHLIVNLSEK